MKKALIVVLTLMMFFLCSCVLSNDDKNEIDWFSLPESPLTDFEYSYDESVDGYYIKKYLGSSDTVVIPAEIDGKPVFRIGYEIPNLKDNAVFFGVTGAFEGSSIVNVVIPDSVNKLTIQAFKDCTNLKNVIFGDNSLLEIIRHYCFEGCTSLEYLDLSQDSLNRIDKFAFKDCTALGEIDIGNNVEYIGEKVFLNCKSLKEIVLPANLKRMGDEIISNCDSLESVFVPKSIEEWGWTFIVNCPKLTDVILEDGIDNISPGLFDYDCPQFIEITIPASVTEMNSTVLTRREKAIFLGDMPHIESYGNEINDITIYYDPKTEGWDTCDWHGNYTLVPIANK